MSSALSKQLRAVVTDFMGNNGEILEQPKYMMIKTGISAERIEFLRQLVDLLTNSRWLNDETKIYLKNKYITKEGVYEELRHLGKEVNQNTIKSNIHNDIKKVSSAFGDRFLVEVIEYSNSDITSYKQILADIRTKKSNMKLLNNICLALPNGDATTSLGEAEFRDFVQIIQPYLRSHVKSIERNISKSAVGYTKYILTSQLLTPVDIERRDELVKKLSDAGTIDVEV